MSTAGREDRDYWNSRYTADDDFDVRYGIVTDEDGCETETLYEDADDGTEGEII